jgi:type IV pilus assembly protein PilM
MAMAKGRNCVGLDIGSSAVKMTVLKGTKRGLHLTAFDHAKLPPEAIVDGAVMSDSVIIEVIGELLSRNKVKSKLVALSVSGNTVIVKKIRLPLMTQEELEESIQWEAEQHIPFNINEVNIGFEVVAPRTDQGQMDVVLVAAKKDLINDYLTVCAHAGLEVVVVDVDAFALQNMYEVNYGFHHGETVVLVDIGHSVVTMNVVTDGVTMFTRDLSLGGSDITEEIQRQLNITYQEAELYKMGGGVASDEVLPQEVESIIQDKAEDMAHEIQRSLDFYAATAAESRIDRIAVSGGTASIPSLVRTIERISGVSTELVNPFQNVTYDERQFSPDRIQKWSPIAAISVGLALRRTNER